MKNMSKPVLLASLVFLNLSIFYSSVTAQQMKYVPVEFNINKTRGLGDNLSMLVDFSSTDGSGLKGIGVLSLCQCACDSLFEWFFPPSDEIIAGHRGAGLLGFPSTQTAFSASSRSSSGTNRISGSLGVTETIGSRGKNRSTPFWVSFVYREED